MNRGNLNVVGELVLLLADGGDVNLAHQVAERALKIAQSATLDQEAGWPVFRPSIALSIIKTAKRYPTHAGLSNLAARLDARYGNRLLPMEPKDTICNDAETSVTIYAWDEVPPNPRQIEDQIEYFKSRGCVFAKEFPAAANAIVVQATTAGTSVVAAFQAAMETGKEGVKQQAEAQAAEPEQTRKAQAPEIKAKTSPRKASEAYAVFKKGSDETYWINPPKEPVDGLQSAKVPASLECDGNEVSADFTIFRVLSWTLFKL